jgi:NADH:ubiquinone oxidoreductase subunit C
MDILASIKERFSGRIKNIFEHSAKRVYVDIDKKDIITFASFLFKDLGMRFSIASGVDTPGGIEILYHFSYDKTPLIVTLRALIEDKKYPQIDSIANIFQGAEWIEREMWEMLGINFKGHPNLKRLLLADEWPEGKYPLRHEHES